MRNKMFKLFVCTLLMGTFVVVTQDTVSADQEGNYIYNVSDGEATITKYIGPGGEITIPSILGGYPTVVIGDNAFNTCAFLTSVTIPENVTIIGDKAFKYCTSLTSVTIPDNVTTIGDYAFYSCTSLTSVIIGNNVTTIGNSTFSYCSALTSMTIGHNVITIGSNAFEHCYSLSTMIIPDSVIVIGDYAFYSCASLTSVIIGNNVTTIGNNAFNSCSNLTSVIIPNNVTTIGDSAFGSCSALTSVTIGIRVKTIGYSAFASCSSLTSISFLGLVVPTTVGINWIKGTPTELRGHAYAASQFPIPGEIVDFHGLKMGTVINILPLADCTWTPTTPTINQTVTFDASTSSDLDGTILIYEWDWNNDSVYEEYYTTPTATHSWTKAGNYSITVRVTDNNDGTSTKTKLVSVSSGGGGEGGTSNEGTPGFEFLIGLGAIAFVFLIKLRNKKRI